MGKSTKILAFLLLVALILILGTRYIDFGKSKISAEVNDEKIYYEEVLQVKEDALSKGHNVTDEEALEQLINKELILQEAKKEGYLPTYEDAESQIILQLENNNISLEDYKIDLESSGITYEEKIETVKEDIAIENYLSNTINQSALKITDEEAKEFYDVYKNQITGEIPPFEESKEEIIGILTLKKQREAINFLLNKLKDNSNIKYF